MKKIIVTEEQIRGYIESMVGSDPELEKCTCGYVVVTPGVNADLDALMDRFENERGALDRFGATIVDKEGEKRIYCSDNVGFMKLYQLLLKFANDGVEFVHVPEK